MQLRKMLSNSFGMTLTEMMIGLGLLGGVSLVSMKLMQGQAGNESYLKWTAAVNKAAMNVQNIMNNSARCNQMFVGETRETTSWPNISPTARFCGKPTPASPCSYALRIQTSSTDYSEILKADQEYAEGFYIPSNGIQLATSASGSSISELVITFKTRNRSLWKNSSTVKGTNAADQGTIVKRIPFITTLNGNTITSCGPVVADEDLKAKEMLCRSLGGAAVWQAATGTCKLNEVSCPPGQVPTQMTSLGNFTCTSVNNATMRDQLFDYSATTCPAGQGVTLTVGAGGKIKAGCTATTSGCPAMTNITWYGVAGAAKAPCVGSIAAGAANNTAVVSDSTFDGMSPGTGTANFICDGVKKAWVLNGTPTCVDASRDCPAGQALYWTGATKFCSTNSPSAGNQGTITTATDGTTTPGGSDGQGTANIECVNGTWSILGGTCL